MKGSASKKRKRMVAVGVVHINATFNNTIVSVTDQQGDLISACSAGMCGFKGSRKSTPYAGQLTAERAVNKAKEHGLKTVSVKVRGPGAGRESAVRALSGIADLTVTMIRDVSSVPHNGCRPPKRRRV